MHPVIASRKRQLDSFFLRAADTTISDELRSDLSRHGIVLICGFIERSVEIVILDRIKNKAHFRIQKFVKGHFKRGTNYDCDAIKQLLERFDLTWSEKFRAFLSSRDDLVQALSSAYALRNSIAHGGTANLGIRGVLDLYGAAQDAIEGMWRSTT